MTLAFADVSEFQTVDWAAYGAQTPAVIVRAAVTYFSTRRHQTVYRADFKWDQNRDGSRRHCRWRGFYIYLDRTADPRKAARLFEATVGPLLPGEVAILDLEEGAGDQRRRRTTFFDELRAPVEWTYSGLFYSQNHLPGVAIDWIAAYQRLEPAGRHTLWQNTDAKKFPGITKACDGNRFDGTIEDLIALTTDQEADMPLSDDDIKKIWRFPGATTAGGDAQTIWRTLVEATVNTRQVAALQREVAGLKIALDTLAKAKGADSDAITKAVIDKINGLDLKSP